jgi:hypothetical protein
MKKNLLPFLDQAQEGSIKNRGRRKKRNGALLLLLESAQGTMEK